MDETSVIVPILIVDDNSDNLLLLEAVLQQPDYKIFQATSGKQAIKLAKNQEFAVIILDVMMPELNGHETAIEIRKSSLSQHTPIIFITAGMNDRMHVQMGYETGADDYIFKPFEPIVMRSKIKVFADLYRIRKENENQAKLLRLHDQQEHYLILEKALDAVIEMNQDGVIVYWNLQAEKIFGYSKLQAIGRRIKDMIILSPGQSRHFLKTDQDPMLNRRIEMMAIRKDGGTFPIELTITSVNIESKKIFAAFIRDISDKKREQETIHLTEESLKHAIEARDEFISVCSHELKTPLTSMKMQFQLAQKLAKEGNQKVFDPESVIKRIKISNKQLNRMSRLIDNMLDVSNINLGKLELEIEEIDLKNLTYEILESFEEQLEDLHIEVKVDINSNLPLIVQGDSYRLEQVMTNLLVNAIKYGNGKPITISLRNKSDVIVFSISDQGLGIDPKDRDKIFNRYERAVDSTKISGLGLGLYISKQIIEAHHGRINVQSQINQGSTFSIELPLK